MTSAFVFLRIDFDRELRSSRHLKITTSDGEKYYVYTTANYLSFRIIAGSEVANVESYCPSILQTVVGKQRFSSTIVCQGRLIDGIKKDSSFIFSENKTRIFSIDKRRRQIDWYAIQKYEMIKPNWEYIEIPNIQKLKEQKLFGVFLSCLTFAHILWTQE